MFFNNTINDNIKIIFYKCKITKMENKMKKLILFKFRVILMIFTIFSASCRTAEKVNGDDYATRGIEYYNNEDYNQAVINLEKALELGTDIYAPEYIHTILGNVYSELGDYSKALECHRQSLEINPQTYQSWVNMGIVYRKLEDFDKAESCYLKAMEVNPEYTEMYVSLGALYIFKQDPETAIKYLQEAISLQPDNSIAWANLAIAQALCGDFKQCDFCIDKAREFNYSRIDELELKIEQYKTGED
ncbi:MAG: hypothetical protein APR63_14650 [Desulfuromonas sp. SDB]|nr:MAG: hypothetical protein APR63_14650 [Desulfuromonas sp. SDB]